MPVSQIQAVAGARSVQHVQSPRSAGYVPSVGGRRTEALPGTGPTVGSEVTATNADVWQLAGYVGAGVKIGIIDYFDFTLWDTNENGPIPDSTHQFCQDTSRLRPVQRRPTASPTSRSSVTTGSPSPRSSRTWRRRRRSTSPPSPPRPTCRPRSTSSATSGVTIVNRSLGAAYDGPGDGTGPLAAVVNSAVGQGMTWFNSAGNDAQDEYMKRAVPTNLGANALRQLQRRPVRRSAPVPTPGCASTPRGASPSTASAGATTGTSRPTSAPTTRSSSGSRRSTSASTPTRSTPRRRRSPRSTSPPMAEPAPDTTSSTPARSAGPARSRPPISPCARPTPTASTSRRARSATSGSSATPPPPSGRSPTSSRSRSSDGYLELYYYDVNGSAAKPVVDSKNAGLVAVGAVESDINYQSRSRTASPTTRRRARPPTAGSSPT